MIFSGTMKTFMISLLALFICTSSVYNQYVFDFEGFLSITDGLDLGLNISKEATDKSVPSHEYLGSKHYHIPSNDDSIWSLDESEASLFYYSPSYIQREERFDNDKIIKINDIIPSYSELDRLGNVDIWRMGPDWIILRASESFYKELMKDPVLKDRIEVIQDNLQTLIDEETFRLKAVTPVTFDPKEPQSWFRDFRTYAQTKIWYKKLSLQHPNLVKYIPSIGEKTFEGRDIFAIKLTDWNIVCDKKAIFLHGLQHPREWISGSTLNYFFFKILNEYLNGNTKIQELLSKIEIILVPVMNPDGYEYTWKRNRLWRKNRNFNGISYGVDLNRNWDDHWGKSGSSKNPFSDIYMGPYAASEVEVRNVQNYFCNHTNIIGAIDLHAYSQLILWPYGYSKKKFQFHDQHKDLAERMALDIKSNSGSKYTCERICDLYLASGSSVDFYIGDKVAKALGYRPYAVTIELRPTFMDSRGFILGPTEIIPTGEEIYPAILGFIEYVLAHPLNHV